MEFFTEFTSSNVEKVAYNADTKNMYVQFLRKKDDGRLKTEYVYKDVEEEEFKLIKESASIGSTLRKVVKGKFFDKTEVPEIF